MKAREELEAALRGEGCLGKAAQHTPDMPVFVLCAGDEIAVHALSVWIQIAVSRGVKPEKLDGALTLAVAMNRWAIEHGTKVPD